ncbi:hypothetical protein GCM10009736_29200 [Actinomadura bangladeshensis]
MTRHGCGGRERDKPVHEELSLLEEYHYGEDVEVEQRYGLASLRDAIAPPMA